MQFWKSLSGFSFTVLISSWHVDRVPRAVQREDSSRQTSASNESSLPVDSCPPSNESTGRSCECSEPNSYPAVPCPEGEWSDQRFGIGPPQTSCLWRGLPPTFSCEPMQALNVLPLSVPRFERWQEATLFSTGQRESWGLVFILINHVASDVRITSGLRLSPV